MEQKFLTRKESIEKGLSDAESGKLKPHSEIRKNMKSGLKFFWTNHASELKKTIKVLTNRIFRQRNFKTFNKIRRNFFFFFLELISINPKIFPFLTKENPQSNFIEIQFYVLPMKSIIL